MHGGQVLRLGSTLSICLLVFAVSVPCAAQNTASLAINAGSATDVTGAGSSALTVAPSFTRASALSTATLGAAATKFANDAWSASIGAAVSGRASPSGISPVIDIALNGATTSYDFSYASADLVPSIESRIGKAKFFVGGRLAAATTSSLPTGPGGTSPIPLPGSRETSSRAATTAIGGVSFTTVTSSGDVTALGYRAEAGVVAGGRQTEHGVNASIANSRLMVGGSAGLRTRVTEPSSFGMATLGIAVRPTVMLQVSAGSYPSNPMFGTAAGKFVNAGFTMRLGRRAGSLPEPSGVERPAAGMTRVSIRASDADRVELAGDFNNWKPILAQRAGNGVWFADLKLPPGEYRYAFRIDGKEWRVPEGVAAVDDEFGGKSAWLTVSRPASK
jgi:hypothetical protein